MSTISNRLKAVVHWFVTHRLNYLATTSSLLLIIHFPPNIPLLFSFNTSELLVSVLHWIIGTAWLAGFLPNRVLKNITRPIVAMTRATINESKTTFTKILSNYALSN